MKINKEWQEYNAIYNEGGEGYNPHNKYVQDSEKKESWGTQQKIMGKMYTVEAAKECHKKLVDSLPKHTNEKMISGCKDCITIFENFFTRFGV